MSRRNLLNLSLVAIVLVASGRAQIPADSFQVGNGRLRIPEPEGFASISPKFPRLFDRFVATESRDNRVLVVHVEESAFGRLSVNQDSDLYFYTKVSAPRHPVGLDESQFKALVSQFELQIGEFFDPNSPDLVAVVKDIRKGLSHHNREDSSFALSGAKDLGSFDRKPRVFSQMVLLNVEGRNGPVPLVATSSMLLLDGQLVFVYTYRRLTEVTDAEALRDFAKKWTTDIIAANEPALAGVK